MGQRYGEHEPRQRVFTPRDDVNTPHESTRLLGRDGRAAQFGCSRSSLVTRRNSAQVVLLCGECSMRASTYDLSIYLSLPLALSIRTFRLFFFIFLFFCLLFVLLYTPQFSPLFTLAAFPSLFFSFLFFTPPTSLLHPSFLSHQLTD